MQIKVKKKVLIFIDWYLPGYKAGGPIQSCSNLIAHANQEFDFYIITRNTDYCSTEPYEDIQSDSWIKTNGTNCYYISNLNLTYNNLFTLVKGVKPDVVYINGVFSMYFSILPVIIARRAGINKILVAGRGMFAPSAVNVKSFKKQLFFTVAKFLKLYKGVKFHATNDTEKADIVSVIGKNNQVTVAPNLAAKVSEQMFNNKREKTAGELRMVSVARIAPEKNTAFALEILRQHSGTESITFDIYGPVYDEAYWATCEHLIAQMPPNVKVKYCGSLAREQVAATLANYHTLLMPTRGENFGHIILESLTAGCVVIISDQTPWKGLAKAGIGYDLPLHAIDAFNDAISELGRLNQMEYDELSDRAFKFAKSYVENTEHIQANINLFN